LREQAIGEQPLQTDERHAPAAAIEATREPAPSSREPNQSLASEAVSNEAMPSESTPVEPVQPVAAQPAPQAATAVAAGGAEAQAATVQPAPEPAPVAVAAEPLPTEELTSVVASAGLEWVQTTHTADIATDAVEPVAVRPRRQRKPKPKVAAEPLQQVETQGGDDGGL
jgi:ribonuclease E